MTRARNTADELSLITAKGDLLAGSASGVQSKLTVGANDTVLTADTTQTNGLKWAAITPTFTTWTPTFKQGTTTFTISNNNSYYFTFGEWVWCFASFDISTGTGQGGGAINCTLPVNAASSVTPNLSGLGTVCITATNYFPGIVLSYGANEIRFKETVGNGVTNQAFWGQASSGFTGQLVSGNEIGFTISYRKA